MSSGSGSNNAFGKRLLYDNAKTALLRGLDEEDVKRAILSQGFLRLESQLVAGKTVYTFNVLANVPNDGQAPRATENRLIQQDAFYVGDVQIYVYKAGSATDYAIKLNTYPNSVDFTNALQLYALYNGYLTLNINQQNIVPQFKMYDFMIAPQTQLTAATNSPITEFSGTWNVCVEPNWVLIGQKNNVFTITLPAGITAVDGFSYIAIVLNGVRAQNVTVVS